MAMSGVSSPRVRRGVPQDWAAALRAVHPTNTAKAVARDIDGSHRTVEKWLAGEAEPSFSAAMALIDCYGPAFLAAILPGRRWIEIARAEAELVAVGEAMSALRARRATLLAREGASCRG